MGRAPDFEQLLKSGYGHIGRVGYLSPGIVDETLSGQFYRMAPPGVTMVRTSLELKDVTVDEVHAAVARTESASAELGKYKPDCIVFGGSPTVAVPGFGSEKTIVEMIERASGCKAFSAQQAAMDALRKYGAKRLALAVAVSVERPERRFDERARVDGRRIGGRARLLAGRRRGYFEDRRDVFADFPGLRAEDIRVLGADEILVVEIIIDGCLIMFPGEGFDGLDRAPHGQHLEFGQAVWKVAGEAPCSLIACHRPIVRQRHFKHHCLVSD